MNTLKRRGRQVLFAIGGVATNQSILNRTGPIFYVVALTGIFGWGITTAIPYVYSELDINITRFFQGVGCFLALELMMNWLCILFVDSSFRPPDHLENGPFHTAYYSGANQDTSQKLIEHHHVHNENQSESVTISPKNGLMQKAPLYFRWTFCEPCGIHTPPRAHHCPLCQTCILKRDHHCFVAASCVGFRNLRHFCVFLFYAVLATIFAMIHALPYAYFEVIPYLPSYLDMIYPITLVRGLLGYLSLLHFCLIFLGWMLLIYLCVSIASLIKLYKLVLSGLTKYEYENNIKIVDTKDTTGKLEAVFGKIWWLNFLFPLHRVFEPIDDPLYWQSMEFCG
ncbi:uncharacterized protein LOC128230241 [Mya arenaria]|uniref:uncharacterized protein LOC128230241 n=1 Tax=Mya arenaria TaxID=6604 RepID=UPI0022E4C7BF|nr:uncharacterized protein LOC128230241 [Mya arenaria]XP_052798312.1 uncharacterized protein LOC128230241 [Mya arenaria]